jgi:hypothetical protein
LNRADRCFTTVRSAQEQESASLILTVNADTTWLLQLPRPQTDSSRRWYNILLDPWLTGSQSDVASWFSRQWHAVKPAFGGIDEVEALCRRVEELSVSASDSVSTLKSPVVDAIAISHEFTDHCHKATLLQCDCSIPVFAATKAAESIKGWKHFDAVIETPTFGGDQTDWRKFSIALLPDWLSITRLVTGKDALYYHSAVMITFSSNSFESAEAIIYTPHGIHVPSLVTVSQAVQSISTLALLHGLHDVSIDWGQQLNLGAHNGLAAQRALNAKYWIGTHDEVKKGGGVVSWFLRRKVYSVKDALESEVKKQGEESKEASDVLGEGQFLDIKNGQSAVLA